MKTIALVGNPNAGKTTIFNALTGGQEQVGNWAGTTVERVEGRFSVDGQTVKVVDLPGIYALSAFSLDERVARDFLLSGEVDLAVVVIDSTNLERNLYLLVQIREIGIRSVACLNMWDEVEKSRSDLDAKIFAEITRCCDVVKTVGNQGRGIDELRSAIARCLEIDDVSEIQIDYGELEGLIDYLCSLGMNRFEALSVIEGDWHFADRIGENKRSVIETRLRDAASLYGDLSIYVAERRYGFIRALLGECMSRDVDMDKRLAFTEYVDRFITNKWFGLPLFLFVMYLMFTTVFKLADPFVGMIETLLAHLADWLGNVLTFFSAPEWLSSFLINGVLDGIGSILVFLPNIFFLYVFISILEDTGYLARAAFLMDKFMHRLGLHGKSFIPMLIGFGCNVPAIMATRTLSNEKDRIVTAFVIPFMSCSARLPIYVLFAGAFFPGRENIVIFSLYVIGILVGIFTAWLFNRLAMKDKESLLIMEMPPYRLPSWKVVWRFSWIRTFEFVKKAWTVILLAVVLIWFLASMPWGVEYASDASLLGKIGKVLAPVFSLSGFGFWQATVALLFGVVAKEVVVGTLGTLLAGGQSEALRTVLPYYFTPISAISFLTMSLLYVPCVATIAVMKKEFGTKWAMFSTIYTIFIAWLLSTTLYQVLRVVSGFWGR